ncbi:MAG: hypothetical protein M3046_15970 [Actinomycetota bacterium]|nr:hypothetical protein [Actinomycetota bacterium]
MTRNQTRTYDELVLLLPLLALPAILLIKAVPRRRRLRIAGVVVLTTAVIVAPWQAYLLFRYEKPAFISYGDGGVVAGANCDATYSGFLTGYWLGLCKPDRVAQEPSVAAEQRRSLGRDYMRHHLGRLPVVVSARVGRIWGVYRPFQMADFSVAEGKPESASLVGWAILWPLLSLAAAGVVILRRRLVPLLPLLAPLVLVTLVAAAFYGLIRFRVPAEPPIVVLAAVAIDAALVRFGSRRKPGVATHAARLHPMSAERDLRIRRAIGSRVPSARTS